MSEHFNQLTPAQLERLAILSEECGEVVQVIGKILRHGLESKHPSGGPTNRELLEKELGDIRLSTYMLANSGDISMISVETASMEKGKRIVKYLHHQPIENKI